MSLLRPEAWVRRLARPQPLYVHARGVWQPSAPGADSGVSTNLATAALPVAGQSHADLSAWIGSRPARDGLLVISSALMHALVLRDAALPLRHESELLPYARQQFALVHGAAAQTWPLALWSDWPLQVACALHGLDLPAMARSARRSGLRLRRARPWWSVAWRRAHADASWAARPRRAVLLVEGAQTTWMVGDGTGLAALTARRLAAPGLAALLELLAELQAADGLDRAATRVVGSGLALDADPDRLGRHAISDAAVLARPWPSLDAIAP